MGAFNYTATDSAGREMRGVIEAETSRHARTLLRARNLFPASIESISDRSPTAIALWRQERLGSSTLVLLTRRWSMLLASGMSLEETLNALIEQVEGDHARAILVGVRAEIQAGHPLSAGLLRFPGVFPELYIGLVRAGEKTGDLATVLERLADYLEARHEARRRLIQALAYPVLVTVVAFAIVVALMSYVVPTVVAVFVHGKQTLPLLTRGLIVVSDFIRNFGWVLLALAAVGAVLARRTLKLQQARYRLHTMLLRLSPTGNLLKSLDSARFASTMAILVGSSVPLMDALATAQGTVRNLRIREAVGNAIQRIREGAPIARSLGAEHVFPPLMIHLIASGEASGALGPMLQRAADQQQKELDHFTALGVAIFEPALIVFMGMLVILIVLAILMPIMEINQLVI
jgi:general secretion pathway protein F